MMKQNTRFNGDGDSCMDLLITNSKFLFMTTNFFETGLRDPLHIYYSQNKNWNTILIRTFGSK